MTRLPTTTLAPQSPEQPHWLARTIQWFLGVEPPPPAPRRAEPRAAAVPREPEAEVRVSAPEPSSWAEAFRRALTDAAATFVQRYVDPYHQEDPSIGFAVRRVRVGLNESAAACLRDFQAMPQTMRDGIAKIRVQKAKGAEQLQLDDFYGITFCASETLVDGQLVETLMYAGGARAALSFQFEGDYVTLPVAPPAAQPPASAAVAPDVLDASSPSDSSLYTRYQTPMQPATPTTAAPTDRYQTPMYIRATPTRQPVARAELHANGQSTTVDLFADGFPYTIGTHPDLEGYYISGKTTDANAAALLPAAQEGGPRPRSYTSRQHLVLQKFDELRGEMEVSNLAHGKNGTHEGATTLGQRFVYHTARAPWLGLGGTVGSTNGSFLELRVVRA